MLRKHTELQFSDSFSPPTQIIYQPVQDDVRTLTVQSVRLYKLWFFCTDPLSMFLLGSLGGMDSRVKTSVT